VTETVAREVDARGLLCPLPVLRARKVLISLTEGEVVRVLADDPMALVDLPHFCNQTGHAHLGVTETGGWQVHLIRRGAEKADPL
jgi:tRNA 2-thiouridine synthesizing protein A